MASVYLNGVSMYSPLIPSWGHFRDVVADDGELIRESEEKKYQPKSLPRNERRRATELVRLTFRVLEGLSERDDIDVAQTSTVFASSGGDYHVVHRIASAVTSAEQFLSPTDFHNSVHNAAAGYWGIAGASHQPSISLSAGDDTFQVGLLEAALQCADSDQPILFVAYDVAPPAPLVEQRQILQPFGVAMLLENRPSDASLAQLQISMPGDQIADTPLIDSLSDVACGNPIARCLPLLTALIRRESEVTFAGSPAVHVALNF